MDSRIRDTYGQYSTAVLKNAIYDSYIRAIRWASDRICKNRHDSRIDFANSPCKESCQCSGVVAYVTNARFLEIKAADGLRKCLADEFSNIYVFHLRGNARTSGELRRKEKDNVFGQGTRTPVAITLLVKNQNSKKPGQIYWHDIGDYLTLSEKLDKINEFGSINGITEADGWHEITPDVYHDWINQRDDSFNEFILVGDKKKRRESTNI